MSVLALVYLLERDLAKAVETAERACEQDDRNYLPRLALTAIHLVSADSRAAQASCEDMLRAKPDLTRNEVLSFLRKALGLPVLALCDQLGHPRSD